ncbi:acyltransferase [bacterium]|nr:acyltransferase [bacterium]
MESNPQAGSSARFYRPEIDGLRAVAVVSVILYHVGLGCRGGYVGVDIFFVISGFLITSILWAEARRKHTVSLTGFWIRRIKRLLPAVVAVTGAIYLAGLFVLLPVDFKEMASSLVWQACLLANLFFWRNTGYFAGAAERKPMLHTWSLAVEEQFYLGLPLLILLLWRRPRLLRATLLFGLLGSLALSAYTYKRMPSACFYLLPTRAWELLLGSALALFPQLEPRSPAAKEFCGWIGLLLLSAPIFVYSSETPFPGPAALPPCLGALLFIAGNAGKVTSSGRLLSLEPIRYVGLMSYSLYLWHWPVISYLNYLRVAPLSSSSRLLALGLIVLLGWLSYALVETRFRSSSWLDRNAFRVALASLAWTFGLYFLARFSQGFPQRYNPEFLQAVDIADHGGFNRDLELADVRAQRFQSFGATSGKPALFVWGDSHAMAVLPGLDEVCRELGIRGLAATHNSSPPILGSSLDERFSQLASQKEAYNQAVFDAIVESPAGQVLLVGAWEDYFGRSAFPGQIQRTVRELAGRGKRVSILLEVPVHEGDIPHLYAMSRLQGREVESLARTREGYLEYSSRSRTTFAGLAGMARVIDPVDFFYPGTSKGCRLEVQGRLIYRDGGHLSDFGSRVFVRQMPQLLSAIRGH